MKRIYLALNIAVKNEMKVEQYISFKNYIKDIILTLFISEKKNEQHLSLKIQLTIYTLH